MRSCLLAISVGLSITLNFVDAFSQTPTCNNLSAKNNALAKKVFTQTHPYDCCDDTMAVCLKDRPMCSLVYRLAENICNRVANGQFDEQIKLWLSRRSRSMLDSTQSADIYLKEVAMAGQNDAPVEIVEYACARCPFCATITPLLYEAISKGRLKGKAKLYFKNFPINSHKWAKESGLGFVAAARSGKFWPFMINSFQNFERFSAKTQLDWAEASGIKGEAFNKLLSDPKTRALLVESKKEGLRNNVTATPTFFINGRKYEGELKLPEVIDVIEEEYERATGVEHRK
ncbi:MAG: thioredoxin domain-containing protein [Pseudomonadota bacterium]